MFHGNTSLLFPTWQVIKLTPIAHTHVVSIYSINIFCSLPKVLIKYIAFIKILIPVGMHSIEFIKCVILPHIHEVLSVWSCKPWSSVCLFGLLIFFHFKLVLYTLLHSIKIIKCIILPHIHDVLWLRSCQPDSSVCLLGLLDAFSFPY